MTPAARRLVLQASAFALTGAQTGNTIHTRRAAHLRRLAAHHDGGWPDALGPVVRACVDLCDALEAQDGSRLLRALERLKAVMRAYLDTCASADAARDDAGRAR